MREVMSYIGAKIDAQVNQDYKGMIYSLYR